MNYHSENATWDWLEQYRSLEESTSEEFSKSLLDGVKENQDNLSYMFVDETTPVRACTDLAYHVTDCGKVPGKEHEQYNELSSQVKRRRMLQFGSEVLDVPMSDESFLRSKETYDSLEDATNEMSQWVAGFTEGTPISSTECLDPSSEVWIADCFNDVYMNVNMEDINESGALDFQLEVAEPCNIPHEYDADAVKRHPVQSGGNVVFKGRQTHMRVPTKQATSVVYPFAFIKPCGMLGDTTLKDINQKMHTPPKSQQSTEPPPDSCLTAPFSGKPVVGKTKIRTEGGKGSITIMRTKG